MHNLAKLLGKAKHELNLIYTEPPAFRNGGRDEGWFCREHAYHTYFLARLLGYPASITVGHFAIRLPDAKVLTSYGTDCDHAWCSVADVSPVDLSISFEYHSGFPSLSGPVMGTGEADPFEVLSLSNPTEFERVLASQSPRPSITYLPHTMLGLSSDSLLVHPDRFFLPSDEGGWLNLYGPEVFCRITMHVFKVMRGRVPSLVGRYNPRDAFRFIRTHYAACRPKIAKLVGMA
jgi:hypothetical protein